MAISSLVERITRYLTEAVMRIFGPNDDQYPLIGVQPFTGELYKSSSRDLW